MLPAIPLPTEATSSAQAPAGSTKLDQLPHTEVDLTKQHGDFKPVLLPPIAPDTFSLSSGNGSTTLVNLQHTNDSNLESIEEARRLGRDTGNAVEQKFLSVYLGATCENNAHTAYLVENAGE